MRSGFWRFATLLALAVLGVLLAFAHLPNASAHGLQAGTGAIAQPFSVAAGPVVSDQSSGSMDTCAGDSWCVYCMNYATSSVCMEYPPVAQTSSTTTASRSQSQPAMTSGAGAVAATASAGNADTCAGDSWCAYCANYPSSSVCMEYPPIPASNTTVPAGHP